ncbi:MAG: RidA family protein [Crocinitomicaceae bacterium]|jgi:2-iminobutanoate/2-iminopropanoate deaminase
MKQTFRIPGAPAPIGPYSPAVLKNDTLYVSGQIPTNPVTGELTLDTIEASTKQIMDNIGLLLNEAGMNYSNIVKVTIFLTNLDDFVAVNGVYGSYFEINPPARETVQVSRLPMNVPIEISCIAVK